MRKNLDLHEIRIRESLAAIIGQIPLVTRAKDWVSCELDSKYRFTLLPTF